jgi:uncharacterized protein
VELAMELSFLTALTIGFLGSAHCIGMCGGIVGALNSGMPHSEQPSRLAQSAHHLTYNAGRIVSYCAAGAIVGLVGAQSAKLPFEMVAPVGGFIAGLVMILLGLYLAGWSHIVTKVEFLGQYVWKYIQPLGKRFMPVHTPFHAFGLGLVWGWLPCGLVYSALALSALSASPSRGALMMFGFGLGTLPMLLAMGGAYEHLRDVVRSPTMRRVAGVVVILFGVYSSLSAMSGNGHHHGASSSTETESHAH